MPVGVRFCGQCGFALTAPPEASLAAPSPSAALQAISSGADDKPFPPNRREPGSDHSSGEVRFGASGSLGTHAASVLPLPVLAPPSIPIQQKLNTGRKIFFIALTLLLLLGAGGAVATYIRTWLQPMIEVSSTYYIGSTPAVLTTTVYHYNIFHVKGQRFLPNSAITFLLNGAPLPGAPRVKSDDNGAFTLDLTENKNWPSGSSNLTARDAHGSLTQTSRRIDVVAPLYQASLTSDPGAWDCTLAATCAFQSDGYHIQAPDNQLLYASFLSVTPIHNLLLEVQCLIANSSPQGGLAIAFRMQSSKVAGYVLLLSQDGSFGVATYDAADKPHVDNFGQMSTSAFHRGLNQHNVITVTANGTQLIFSINSQEIIQISDSTYSAGMIALGVIGKGTVAVFSNLLVATL